MPSGVTRWRTRPPSSSSSLRLGFQSESEPNPPISCQTLSGGTGISTLADAVAMPSSSELHHRAALDLPLPEQVDVFVDPVEREHLEGVADLAFSGERHDLAQVVVVAPERAVEGLFARDARKQRDVDAVADQSDINVVAANRQQVERQPHHLSGAGAVDDSVEVGSSRGLAELLADVGGRLTLVDDDVVGPVFLRDGEVIEVAVESDHRSAASEELGVLNSVVAQPADAENADDPIRTECARVAELLEAAIWREARVAA